jgi:hypothetical protein
VLVQPPIDVLSVDEQELTCHAVIMTTGCDKNPGAHPAGTVQVGR